MNNFLLALQFLTRFPVSVKTDWKEENIAASLLWYPLVGVIIGGLLALMIALLAGNMETLLQAALVLSVWVFISGGLHLDGLADSADAWLGSHGDRQRALDIMKDPQAGPMAVIVLLLVLLIKFSALYSLLKQPETGLIILPLVVSRSVPLLLFLTTPYVREQGLGSAMAKYLPRKSAWKVLILPVVLLVLMAGFINGVLLSCAVLLLVWWLRFLMLKHLGGMTGDTIGAAIEITEMVTLVLLVLMI